MKIGSKVIFNNQALKFGIGKVKNIGGFFDGRRKEKITLDNQTRLGYTGREVK